MSGTAEVSTVAARLSLRKMFIAGDCDGYWTRSNVGCFDREVGAAGGPTARSTRADGQRHRSAAVNTPVTRLHAGHYRCKAPR